MLRHLCRFFAGLAALALCAGGSAEVGLSLSGLREYATQYPGHENHSCVEQQATFHLDKAIYAIKYTACVDKAHGGRAAPIEGYVGLPLPCPCNWYHSGFLFISLNGQDIGTAPLSSMSVAERGTRAILDLVWHHELASVRARFVGLQDHDNLYCEVTLDPKAEITAISVRLRCYPSFFTAWHHRDGARRIQTPSTLVVQDSAQTVAARDNWWAVYYDEVFDVAKGEGEGPCAMLMLPEEPSEITFAPGSYAVTTTITYPPESRRLHLAFWEFPHMANAEALTRLQDGAEAVRDELSRLDFTPAGLRNLDVAAMRAQVQRALDSEVARLALGGKIEQVREWLDKYAPALERPAEALGVEAEETLLQSLDRYYSFMWELKLAELLAEL